MKLTFRQRVHQWRSVLITAPSIAVLIMALRLTGGLQLLEWIALDQFFRWKPTEPIDPRIVIVAIYEKDIQRVGQWPIADAVLTQLLQHIQNQRPRAIGLDLYRDLPVAPGYGDLVNFFKNSPHVIGIAKVIGNHYGAAVAAPKALLELGQVGASDILIDQDGKVRRALVSVRPKEDEATVLSLSARLALLYLQQEGISLEVADEATSTVKLGRALFRPLKQNDGGYIRVDDNGYQILFNFRKHRCPSDLTDCTVFQTVSMTDVLQGRVPQDLFRDRIVIIGSKAESVKDRFFTPYSRSHLSASVGAEIHAELVSQMLGAALDGRPLLQVWPDWLEYSWIALWSGVGAILGFLFPSWRWSNLGLMLAGGGLSIGAYLALLNGWWIPIVPPLLSLTGSAVGLTAYIARSERQRSEAQLRYNAYHDMLTALPNRAFFVEHLQKVIQQNQQDSAYQFGILFLDVNRFKFVNDALGHLAGDVLLIAVAERMKICLRSSDVLARWGGDEFVILLDRVGDAETSITIAERINQQFRRPFNIKGHEIFSTCSIGIVLSQLGYQEPEDYLGAADVAMYRAKSLGKSYYQIFDKTMQAQAAKLLQLENDLRRGLERPEFQVYYQPIVAAQTESLVGFEALVRWQHPERGFVSPTEFIPLAEETGLIVFLGEWVLRTACRQMRLWQDQFPDQPLTLSVNLSLRQFLQSNLVEQISSILEEAAIRKQTLKLEITESAVMQDAEATIATLRKLKNLDLQLSVDDFGTGYSSLSYLHRFPIDMLKIDRSFVSGLGSDPESLEIVRTIMTLAHALGLSVVAEGVETTEQLSILRKLGCEYVQGYLFSKPMDRETAEQFIDQQQLLEVDPIA